MNIFYLRTFLSFQPNKSIIRIQNSAIVARLTSLAYLPTQQPMWWRMSPPLQLNLRKHHSICNQPTFGTFQVFLVFWNQAGLQVDCVGSFISFPSLSLWTIGWKFWNLKELCSISASTINTILQETVSIISQHWSLG